MSYTREYVGSSDEVDWGTFDTNAASKSSIPVPLHEKTGVGLSDPNAALSSLAQKYFSDSGTISPVFCGWK